MVIESQFSCKANGIVYECFVARDLAGKHALRGTSGNNGKATLPCYLFELPEEGAEAHLPTLSSAKRSNGNRTFVAVYPETRCSSATWCAEELDECGLGIGTHTHKTRSLSVALQSRLNRLTSSDVCSWIRTLASAHRGENSELYVNQAISDGDFIILRGAFRVFAHGYAANPDFCCFDSHMTLLDVSFTSMGTSCINPAQPGDLAYTEHAFSVRIPHENAPLQPHTSLTLLAQSSSHSETYSFVSLTFDRMNSLIAASDGQFLDAARDPYYPEWLYRQRPSASELALQATHAFPYMPRFSLVVSVDVQDAWFKELASSIRRQSYQNWELLLADSPTDPESKPTTLAKVIERASGDYLVFLDAHDVLEPHALFEYARALNNPQHDVLLQNNHKLSDRENEARVRAINELHPCDLMYCDEGYLAQDGSFQKSFFKPDFDMELLRTQNYLGHLLAVRRDLLGELVATRSMNDHASLADPLRSDPLQADAPRADVQGASVSQIHECPNFATDEYDFVLRVVEQASRCIHVPKVLCHRRDDREFSSTNEQKDMRAISAHLGRLGIGAQVVPGQHPHSYRVLYDAPAVHPLVSIVIPTSDHVDTLRTCIASILEKTTYEDFEIVVVENNSTEQETFDYYDVLLHKHADRVRVITWPSTFNFSGIVNFGAEHAKGDFLVLLNSDTELITPSWLERFVGICSRPEVGAVGALLYYPDETIQHAGVVVSDGANHLFWNLPRENGGYYNLAHCQRQLSAVTAACMMVKRTAWNAVGGFDEEFSVCYNDVDFCLKLREQNYLVVYTPEVELYHYEMLVRGRDNSREQALRYARECALLKYRWNDFYVAGDPYFTPNVRREYPWNGWYHF